MQIAVVRTSTSRYSICTCCADNILYYVDPKNNGKKRAVVPKQLQKDILEENHSGGMACHLP